MTPEQVAERDAIDAAHPLQSGRHDLYNRAMRLVGERHAKGDLVDLVVWLLLRAEPCLGPARCQTDGMRAVSVLRRHFGTLKTEKGQIGPSYFDDARATFETLDALFTRKAGA